MRWKDPASRLAHFESGAVTDYPHQNCCVHERLRVTQVYDLGNGQILSEQIMIDLPGHSYHAFKACPHGSVASTAAGGSHFPF